MHACMHSRIRARVCVYIYARTVNSVVNIRARIFNTLRISMAIFGIHHQVSILAIYLNIVLGQTAVAVVLTVWILNLHFRDDKNPPGKGMRKVAFIMQSLMCQRKTTLVSLVRRSETSSWRQSKERVKQWWVGGERKFEQMNKMVKT